MTASMTFVLSIETAWTYRNIISLVICHYIVIIHTLFEYYSWLLYLSGSTFFSFYGVLTTFIVGVRDVINKYNDKKKIVQWWNNCSEKHGEKDNGVFN